MPSHIDVFQSATGPTMFSQREVSIHAGAASSAPVKRSLSMGVVFEASTADGAYGVVNYSLIGPKDGQARAAFILAQNRFSQQHPVLFVRLWCVSMVLMDLDYFFRTVLHWFT